MISFLNIAFLAALPLIGIPILIHLLNRRRKVVIHWGAMRFLEEATPRRKRFMRVDDWLLMLLRLLALLLLILALAQPRLRVHWLGAEANRDVVLILDRSMSGAVVPDQLSAFELQLQQAEEFLGTLKPRDTVRVLDASGPMHWISGIPVPMDGASRRQLLSKLKDLKPGLGTGNFSGAILKALSSEIEPDRSMRLVAILSDGFSEGWAQDAGEAWKSVGTAVEDSSIPASVVSVMPATEYPALSNLSVDSIQAGRTLAAVGQVVTIRATVSNTGLESTGTSMLTWTEDGFPVSRTTISPLAPGEKTERQIQHSFVSAGPVMITAGIEANDSLRLDDESSFVVEVVETVPVLVVHGSAEVRQDPEARFFLHALRGSDDGGMAGTRWAFREHVARTSDFHLLPLDPYACVVLLDPGELNEEALRLLMEYVQGGGGLWMTAGERTHPEIFNRIYHAAGAGLSRRALEPDRLEAEDAEQPLALALPLRSHAATDVLRAAGSLDLDRVELRQSYQFAGVTDESSVRPLIISQNGVPLAIEEALGKGRVILQVLPLDKEWSMLPLSRSFVVLVHEWLWRLSETSSTQFNLDPGDAIVFSGTSEDVPAVARLHPPSGPDVGIEPFPHGDSFVFRYPETGEPGTYTLESGDHTNAVFVVRRDPVESNLEFLEESGRETIARSSGIRFTDSLSGIIAPAAGESASPRAAWWALLSILVVLMIVEILLGFVLNRRRLDTSGAVNHESGVSS